MHFRSLKTDWASRLGIAHINDAAVVETGLEVGRGWEGV